MTEARTGLRRDQIGVVFAAALGMAFGYGNILYLCFGLFVHPLSETFGWTRGQISLGVGMMNAMVVLVTPVMGAFFDRWGVRKLLLPATALFALGIAAIALLNGSLWQLYLTLMFVGATGPVTTPAGYNRVLVEWFDRKRGFAFGIALAGTGIGGMLLPPVVSHLLKRGGTPLAALSLAAMVGLIALPVAFLRLKEPEHRGDCDRIRLPTPLGVLLRDTRFIKMIFAFFVLGIFATAIAEHLPPMLVDRGMTSAQAALAMSLLAAAMAFGRVGVGYLLDELPPWAVLIPFLSAPMIGLALLAWGATGILALLSAFLIGLGLGTEFDFLPYAISRYFPVRSFSRNFGVLFSIMTVGGALGPVILGYVYDRLGAYRYGLWTLSGLIALALVLLCSCGRYPEQGHTHAKGDIAL